MADRALAHVEIIKEINPIENADRIKRATVLGWNVVISINDNFNVGDKVIYIEIDSLLPERPEFEFMRDRKFKVKTIRLRGCYSQGLIVPLSVLGRDAGIGEDVTKELGIKYYVPEDNIRKSNTINPETKYTSMKARHKKIFSNRFVKKMMKYSWFKKLMFIFFGKKKDKPKGFPTEFEFVHKTDQTRVENVPGALEDKSPLIRTEKCDGSSATYILAKRKRGKYEFFVCSRNVRMLKPDQESYYKDKNYYWECAFKYNIENKLMDFMRSNPTLDYVCWQGEICAPAIQKNPHHLKETHLYLFHMIDSAQGRYDIRQAQKIWQDYEMEIVPIDEELYVMPDTMEELKQSAEGYYNPSVCEGNNKCSREGYVYYSIVDPSRSFKNVSRSYLLKHSNDDN